MSGGSLQHGSHSGGGGAGGWRHGDGGPLGDGGQAPPLRLLGTPSFQRSMAIEGGYGLHKTRYVGHLSTYFA